MLAISIWRIETSNSIETNSSTEFDEKKKLKHCVKVTGLAVASHFHMEDKRANNEGGEKTATERCIWPLWWC